MNPRSTALLLLVAAVLGAFVYLYEVRGGEERKEAEQTAKRLFPGVSGTDVAWIELTTNDGKTARAERKEGAWQVVAPLSFPGDAVNLDGIAASLADLTSEKEIESPQSPEVYGLGGASRIVRFGAGGKDHALSVGKKAPVGSGTYVATAEQPGRIVTIPTYRATNLERSLDDLRDRRVMNFDRASIESADVRWPGGHVRLERSGSGWKMTEPIAGPADDATVDALLSNLGYLRADSFEDAPGPDAATGMDRPALEVTLAGQAGADGQPSPVFHVAFGAEQNGKRLVRAAQPSLYRVAAQRLDDFARTVVAYRFKEVSHFVATDAHTVELALRGEGGATLDEKLEHADAGWTGSPEAVDPGKAARLAAELARLRAADIVTENASDADLARLGLDPPRVRIRVVGASAGTPPLATVDVGADSDGKGPVARDPASKTVYRLAPTVKEWLPVGLESFRTLFAAKPPQQGAAATDAAPPGEEPANPLPEGRLDE